MGSLPNMSIELPGNVRRQQCAKKGALPLFASGIAEQPVHASVVAAPTEVGAASTVTTTMAWTDCRGEKLARTLGLPPAARTRGGTEDLGQCAPCPHRTPPGLQSRVCYPSQHKKSGKAAAQSQRSLLHF